MIKASSMTSASLASDAKQLLLVTLGAIGGAILGVAITYFLAGQGVRAAAIPGGLLGLAAGMFRHRSIAVPILCSIAALSLGLVVEWKLFPFAKDGSFTFFISHLQDKHALILVMLVIGAVVGFYSPYRAMAAPAAK
jgi:hypothetical protein